MCGHETDGAGVPAPGFARFTTDCKHLKVTDEMMRKGIEDAERYWDSSRATQICPSCGEYLYPELEDDEIVVYVGEPKFAGAE